MAVWSAQQLRLATANAGFRQGDDVTMTAIILAESGGDPNAVSKPNANGTRDYGLAQINSVHFGERIDNGIFGTGIAATTLNAKNVLDPQINLAFANKLYKARGGAAAPDRFKDWTAYNSGAYNKFTTVAGGTTAPKTTPNQDAANNGDLGAYPGALKDSVGNADVWTKTLTDTIFPDLKNGAINGGIALIAIILIALGIVILLKTKTPVLNNVKVK